MSATDRPRILVGPFLEPQWSEYMGQAFDDFDTLTFGAWEGSDLRTGLNPVLNDILAVLPEGWTPDLFVLWRPEYGTIPRGLEDAPFPTSAWISDWYLAFSDCLEAAWRVDTLVTGTRGERIYRAAGFDHVIALPMLGYDPRLDGQFGLPHAERDIDVYCGSNPNWKVHAERARVHERMRQLPDSVNLIEGGFVDREEFNRRMGRARIFVNQTVIGEINMKVYEATASGTCLFVEDTNLDIRDYLTDGESVVLFNRDNINGKLLYYLEHEDERARIADAGRERMKPYTYRTNARTIVERLLARGLRSGGRPIVELSARERLEGLAGFGLRHNGGDWLALLPLCAELGPEPRPQLILACAQYAARVLTRAPGVWSDPQILRAFAAVANAAPHYLPAWYCWTKIAVEHLEPGTGARALERTEEMLRSGCPVPFSMADPYLAMEQNRRFIFERTAWEALEAGKSIDDALRPLLLEELVEVRAKLTARS